MNAAIESIKPQLPPPSRLLLLAEGRALWEAGASLLAWPMLRRAPRGDGHPVLVLPGLCGGDASTVVLRRYLNGQGLRASGWGQGLNLGPRKGVEAGLNDLLQSLNDRHGRTVSVVGWSLGGMYARLLASAHPQRVRSVVTLGSPFSGGPHSTHAWRLYQAVSGLDAHDPVRMRQIAPTPSVPTTSIYSRTDGVVAWRGSLEQTGPQAENIEVIASHVGLGAHPAVLYALADRLAQPEGAWQPFRRPALSRWFYPGSTTAAVDESCPGTAIRRR